MGSISTCAPSAAPRCSRRARSRRRSSTARGRPWSPPAAAALALLADAAAPVTGLGDAGLAAFPVSSLRYLLPATDACALAARRSRSATAWSVGRDLKLGFPFVGALAAAASSPLAQRLRGRLARGRGAGLRFPGGGRS